MSKNNNLTIGQLSLSIFEESAAALGAPFVHKYVLEGLAYSAHPTQDLIARAQLISEVQELSTGYKMSKDQGRQLLDPKGYCTPDDLLKLGCIRAYLEVSGGHWARQTNGARGWALLLQGWKQSGWVSWWERGSFQAPAYPFIIQGEH